MAAAFAHDFGSQYGQRICLQHLMLELSARPRLRQRAAPDLSSPGPSACHRALGVGGKSETFHAEPEQCPHSDAEVFLFPGPCLFRLLVGLSAMMAAITCSTSCSEVLQFRRPRC